MGLRGPKATRETVEASATFDVGRAVREARAAGTDRGQAEAGWALFGFRLRLEPEEGPPTAYLVWQGSDGSEEVLTQHILLAPIPSHVGGRRWAALCGCGRRVAKLYRPKTATAFACRICHKLVYYSRRISRDHISKKDRALARRLECRPADVNRALFATIFKPRRRPPA